MIVSSRSALGAMFAVLLVGGCGTTDGPGVSIGTIRSDSTTTAIESARAVGVVESTDFPSTTTAPARASNGRAVPLAPTTAAEAAALFVDTHEGLRDDTRTADHADLGHQHQLVVRSVARNPGWVAPFLDALPSELVPVARLHLQAREALARLHTAPPLEQIPVWHIVPPEPLDRLVASYREAEEATGIDWRVLAAINLIETGMGRIDGLSSAGAQGPMQFLPTTWEEVAEGGDIDDPHDAIQGAARYLVRRGGLDDIRAGLWGYNNSDDYVDAVLAYAELLAVDEHELRAIYHWEIYVGTTAGTLWLPVGFRSEAPLPAPIYLAENAWAKTLP